MCMVDWPNAQRTLTRSAIRVCLGCSLSLIAAVTSWSKYFRNKRTESTEAYLTFNCDR